MIECEAKKLKLKSYLHTKKQFEKYIESKNKVSGNKINKIVERIKTQAKKRRKGTSANTRKKETSALVRIMSEAVTDGEGVPSLDGYREALPQKLCLFVITRDRRDARS